MKKILASVGIVAVGATAAHVQAAGSDAADSSKPWSVSATLRGFYDDNYITAPKGYERDSFGISISPSVALKLPLDQTDIDLKYTYGATWYADRSDVNSDNNAWDQSHQLDASLLHRFNERYSVSLRDSFVVAQEPELLTSGPITLPYRIQGNNIHNHGEALLNGALTRQLGFVVGYQNNYYDYENNDGNFVTPSLSGLLDRVEHLVLANLRWQMQPETVLVLGYNYGQVDYQSDEIITFIPTGPSAGFQTSKLRNNRSHYVYAGIDQNFSKDLVLSVRGGGQWTDYYNDPANNSATSPYGSVSLNYAYLPGSSVEIGFTHSRNQTDILAPDASGKVTADQQSSVIYGSIHHKFDAKISGNASIQWQNSDFNGGLYDGQTDNFLDAGVGLTYQFNRHLAGEVGYNFSNLSSDIPGRDYDRNRVYLGVTATY
jgi:hypothetical protein